MNPEVADMQYVHPPTLTGVAGQLSSDGGFGGFGADNDDLPGGQYGGLKLWETKYQFQKDMLPMFVGEAFGKKVRCSITSIVVLRFDFPDLVHGQEFEFHSL